MFLEFEFERRTDFLEGLDGFLRIQLNRRRVLANKVYVEDSARKYMKLLAFDRFEESNADVGCPGDPLQRDTPR